MNTRTGINTNTAGTHTKPNTKNEHKANDKDEHKDECKYEYNAVHKYDTHANTNA